ncbi:hypothetical protein HRR78_007661 [Exophiala dermatitidis]|nr:hypothetical protein HRR75_007360 [Exophiala dermatitidis]KAJ4539615.1 hypothetical protein HRR78_007661 [Exophiala dermatitidis]
MSQINLNIRYNALPRAVAELHRTKKPENTGTAQGIFKKDHGTDSKEIEKTYTADENKHLNGQAAECFQYDAPHRIAQIESYLRKISALHHMLAQEAIELNNTLQAIRETRATMDRQRTADVRLEVRERIRAGTKRKANSEFPSHIFIEFGIDELDMLRDNYTAHMKFMEHVETWRIGNLNAVSDGASLSTISMLFSPDTAAQCLGAAGIDTAGIRGAALRENGIPYYGAPFYDTVEAADEEFEKQVVWDKPGKWIEQSMLANMASEAMTPQLFRADATFIDDGELGKTAKELAKMATLGLSILPESKVSSSLYPDEESDDEKSDLEGMIQPSFVPEQYYSPLPALPLDPAACCI